MVCYFDDKKGESVTDHYCSLEMTIVNAETVYKALMEQLEADGIPITNLISVLTDCSIYEGPAQWHAGKTEGQCTTLIRH